MMATPPFAPCSGCSSGPWWIMKKSSTRGFQNLLPEASLVSGRPWYSFLLSSLNPCTLLLYTLKLNLVVAELLLSLGCGSSGGGKSPSLKLFSGVLLLVQGSWWESLLGLFSVFFLAFPLFWLFFPSLQRGILEVIRPYLWLIPVMTDLELMVPQKFWGGHGFGGEDFKCFLPTVKHSVGLLSCDFPVHRSIWVDSCTGVK